MFLLMTKWEEFPFFGDFCEFKASSIYSIYQDFTAKWKVIQCNSTLGSYAQWLINALLEVFGMNPTMERWAHDLTRALQKRQQLFQRQMFPKLCKLGFSPMEYVIPVGQPRDCQLNLHYIMLWTTVNKHTHTCKWVGLFHESKDS